MGESTCLVHLQHPLSYVSGFPDEAKEASSLNLSHPIHALGQSVSFGRFMSETLAWEKWSSFSSHRYVEEAERCARPGSVSQKKAFFEAHYKEIAARKKAAALLEEAQEDALNINIAGGSELGGVVDGAAAQNSQMIPVDKQEEATNVNEQKSNASVSSVDKSKNRNVPGEKSVDAVNEMDNSLKIKSSSQFAGEIVVKDSMVCGTTQIEKPLLKSSDPNQDDGVLVSKKKSPFSSSFGLGRATRKPPTPTASSQSKKEANDTPINKKAAKDSANMRRYTQKSVHQLICFTPARKINRLTSTIIRKINGSKVTGSNAKASKDCSTPLGTPTTASVNGAPKQPLATPWSENRSGRTPHDLTPGSKTDCARWNFLPRECSKFLSACTSKLHSKNSITPFRFWKERRAARRSRSLKKNSTTAKHKLHEEKTTLKEKAETGKKDCSKPKASA